MLNRVILIGRLTRDPELRYTTNGTAVCQFTLAVPRKFNKDQSDFIDHEAWRGLAENVANYLKKGSMAAVEGRIQIDNYEKDGQKRKSFKVVCDDVRFLSSSGNQSNSNKRDPEDYDPGHPGIGDGWDDVSRQINYDAVREDPETEIPF